MLLPITRVRSARGARGQTNEAGGEDGDCREAVHHAIPSWFVSVDRDVMPSAEEFGQDKETGPF